MIVEQIGYLTSEDVLDLIKENKLFNVYKTHKGTHIIVLNTEDNILHLSYPKKDRLPWKIIEGKKIVKCKKVLKSDYLARIWENNEQIMTYKEFTQ